MLSRPAAVALLSLAVACAPPDRAGPVTALVYRYDATNQTYAVAEDTIASIDSLRALRGPSIDVRRGANLDLLGSDAEAVSGGIPFDLAWSVRADGVVVPADQQSFEALSMYRHLERAIGLFALAGDASNRGWTPVRPIRVLYLPRMDTLLGDLRPVFTDNAAYEFTSRSFLALPPFLASTSPLMLNAGVVGHELGHAVIHELMFGDVPTVPTLADADADVKASRHLRTMHEGVADVLGYAVTGDPDFIDLAALAVDRNMGETRDLTADDVTFIEVPDGNEIPLVGQFDPYRGGTILARLVHETWTAISPTFDAASRDRLIALTLTALRNVQYDATFHIGRFVDAFVAQLTDEERTIACPIVRTRFAPLLDRMSACPETP